MNEIDKFNLQPGDRVKYLDIDEYIEGEVTIVNGNTAKVIFDSPSDLNYDYYSLDKLELISK